MANETNTSVRVVTLRITTKMAVDARVLVCCGRASCGHVRVVAVYVVGVVSYHCECCGRGRCGHACQYSGRRKQVRSCESRPSASRPRLSWQGTSSLAIAVRATRTSVADVFVVAVHIVAIHDVGCCSRRHCDLSCLALHVLIASCGNVPPIDHARRIRRDTIFSGCCSIAISRQHHTSPSVSHSFCVM